MNKILLQALLEDARAGKPVYITTVHHVFDGLHHAESERIVCVVDQMDTDGQTAYELRIPSLERGAMRRPRTSCVTTCMLRFTTSCRASAAVA